MMSPAASRVRCLMIMLMVLGILPACGLSPACAAVMVNFSGGGGAPLSLTLPQPLSYTINANGTGGPFFIFDGAGNVFAGASQTLTGDITYAIDGGSPTAITFMNSGAAVNSMTPDDLFMNPTGLPGETIGQVFTLTAGTLTTTSNVAAAAPPSGFYETWIVNNSGVKVSANGVIAPEPTTLGLLSLAAIGLMRRRRA